jgi:hypothetical protein
MCFGHKAAPAYTQEALQKDLDRYAKKQHELEKEVEKRKKKAKKHKQKQYGFRIGNLGNVSNSYSPGVSL